MLFIRCERNCSTCCHRAVGRNAHFGKDYSLSYPLFELACQVCVIVGVPWRQPLLYIVYCVARTEIPLLLYLQGKLDPKKLQLQLTGFLEKSTGMFMEELWGLLLDAQNSLGGIPSAFLQEKKQEMLQAKVC